MGNYLCYTLFDLNGIKIKEFDYLSTEITYYIDIFYDIKSKNTFIITGNFGKIISYDYKKNRIYHKYDDSDKTEHFNLIINDKEKIVKLIESGEENIQIWNFHSGKLLIIIEFIVFIYGIMNIYF